MTRWILVTALAIALAGGGVQAADEGASSAEGTQTTPVETAPPGPDDEADAGSASDEAGPRGGQQTAGRGRALSALR